MVDRMLSIALFQMSIFNHVCQHAVWHLHMLSPAHAQKLILVYLSAPSSISTCSNPVLVPVVGRVHVLLQQGSERQRQNAHLRVWLCLQKFRVIPPDNGHHLQKKEKSLEALF